MTSTEQTPLAEAAETTRLDVGTTPTTVAFWVWLVAPLAVVLLASVALPA